MMSHTRGCSYHRPAGVSSGTCQLPFSSCADCSDLLIVGTCWGQYKQARRTAETGCLVGSVVIETLTSSNGNLHCYTFSTCCFCCSCCFVRDQALASTDKCTTHTDTRTCAYTHTRARAHTQTHTHTHTNTHTRTHIYNPTHKTHPFLFNQNCRTFSNFKRPHGSGFSKIM